MEVDADDGFELVNIFENVRFLFDWVKIYENVKFYFKWVNIDESVKFHFELIDDFLKKLRSV